MCSRSARTGHARAAGSAIVLHNDRKGHAKRRCPPGATGPAKRTANRPERNGTTGDPSLRATPGDDMATSDNWLSMRASDADRERAADVLKAALAEGRLDWDEHRERLDAVMRARTYGELRMHITDLPVGPMPFPGGMAGNEVAGGEAPRSIASRESDDRQLEVPRIPAQRAAPPAPLANPWSHYVPAPVRMTEPLAKISVVCAILGFLTSGMAAVPAIITGHLALARLRRTNDEGVGLAVTGLVLGYLELLFLAVWFILVIILHMD
mgnify:CR=1 FL=1